jgi:hypothetical protein
MSGSYSALRTKYAQLQTFVAQNAVTLTGDNVFTGNVEFVNPLTVNDLEVIGDKTFAFTPRCSAIPDLAQDN